MNLISDVQPGGGLPLYQLKITLKWSKPPIWRRVVVRGDMTLDDLHHIIQIAMGWTDSHLHQFIGGSGCARTFYGRPDPEFADMESEVLNEKNYTVADLAPAAKRKFIYEYDFGDGWQHDVVAEKILSPDPAFKHPVCLAGANACPPEARLHSHLVSYAMHGEQVLRFIPGVTEFLANLHDALERACGADVIVTPHLREQSIA